MSEPFPGVPQTPAGDSAASLANEEPELARRRLLLRRLAMLLVAAVAAFSLTTWLLLRLDTAALAQAEPAAVVRQHLDALNRGDLRAAYAFFSESYRERIAFEAYNAMVAEHREIFTTRKVEFENQQQSGARAVLTTRLLAADGGHYVARFSLIRQKGRWWIDDVRWSAEPRDRRTIRI
jgi:ketosteroid isomerase-like protein